MAGYLMFESRNDTYFERFKRHCETGDNEFACRFCGIVVYNLRVQESCSVTIIIQ